MHISLVRFSAGSALGEVGTWTVVWWPVVSEMLVPKTIKIWSSSSSYIDNVRDVFDVFLFISTPISCVPFSPGSAEAHVGWGGNLNGCLMASCVRNIRTKKLLKILLQVTSNNVANPFWDTAQFDAVFSFQRPFHVFRFPQVAQKHTLGEVGTWAVAWWPVVSGIFEPN